MRLAISLDGDTLAPHFGHCDSFAFIDADPATRSILSIEHAPAPPHQPGFLPGWLNGRGAQVVIAARMGSHAKGLFEQLGITVVAGAPALAAEALATHYLQGTLVTEEQPCDH
jgi:predicted Fe-Mo cluster-binding NifX family protein